MKPFSKEAWKTEAHSLQNVLVQASWTIWMLMIPKIRTESSNVKQASISSFVNQLRPFKRLKDDWARCNDPLRIICDWTDLWDRIRIIPFTRGWQRQFPNPTVQWSKCIIDSQLMHREILRSNNFSYQVYNFESLAFQDNLKNFQPKAFWLDRANSSYKFSFASWNS